MMDLRSLILALAAFHFLAAHAIAQEFKLELPLACELGTACWVQQYPDHDSTTSASDYTCGTESYDGHDGTDIRISTTRDKVDVIASAAGKVKGMRDGIPDHIIVSEAERANIKGIECGNGVVIDHGNGFETQYCHMRAGSLAVQDGETVSTGQKLGEVGFSGDVQFPHVHLSVRKDGKKMDPFSGTIDAPCGQQGTSLWSDRAKAALQYRTAEVIEIGFAGGRVNADDLQYGIPEQLAPKATWIALVSHVRLINVLQGDEITVSLSGPQGELARNQAIADHSKATFMLLAGKKRPETGWPKGKYTASVSVKRAGEVVSSKSVDAEIE